MAVDQQRRNESGADLEQLLDDVKQIGRSDEPIFDVINLQLMRPWATTSPPEMPSKATRASRWGVGLPSRNSFCIHLLENAHRVTEIPGIRCLPTDLCAQAFLLQWFRADQQFAERGQFWPGTRNRPPEDVCEYFSWSATL